MFEQQNRQIAAARVKTLMKQHYSYIVALRERLQWKSPDKEKQGFLSRSFYYWELQRKARPERARPKF